MLRFLYLILLALAGAFGQSHTSSLTSTLPASLQEQGQALLAETNEKTRAAMADAIGKANPAATRAFLLAVLESDSSPGVRRAVLDRLMRAPGPEVMRALARHAASDPDAEVAIFALDRYRYERMMEMRRLLDQRLALSAKTDDAKGTKLLAKEDERWISLLRGTMLPTFLQEPPPLFTLKAPGEAIRVLAFGDYGNGTKEQRDVAAAMKSYQGKNRFDFGITLGDNFYSKGMLSITDPHWKAWWDDMYDRLGIRFYATLGNHDWGYADSPAAEILYTKQSNTWRMPATYYTFTAGPVQFFALDTNEISRAQLAWLDEQIGMSTARWKLVYGHHPIYSAGAHADNAKLIGQLLPILRNRVDVYLAGHDHDMQHLKTEAGVHFFVAGGGGAELRTPQPGPRSIFAQAIHGFAVLEANAASLQIHFLDTNLKELYGYSVKR